MMNLMVLWVDRELLIPLEMAIIVTKGHLAISIGLVSFFFFFFT